MAGELVGYKKVDLAVEAFNKLGERLVVIGGGSELDRLKQLASDNVELKGKVSQSDFISYVQGCRALIFPGEEDFGIVPIEAMASGKPVLAYKSGGALDYVIPNKTGNFFKEQSVESLISCVEHFEQEEAHYSTSEIKEFAQSFTQSVFKEKFKSLVSQAIQDEACL
ncbi:hypothetical protein GCM10025791_17480 [Halioxenophilus aromaticivorans]|uniref:Glycosyl transferase family 1 domain-containing protein n=1 Tax=Halioxenophilus aromaticivorans TaxID=1306992 RepID=A0AAV3U1U2_9ALTE